MARNEQVPADTRQIIGCQITERGSKKNGQIELPHDSGDCGPGDIGQEKRQQSGAHAELQDQQKRFFQGVIVRGRGSF